ncbi:MAG: VOC family protein [Burkholderiales bacterium]|nr:VOC family protein [Burkholderiales bacterium]
MTVDHLVIMAASLEQGVAWCEATLGVTPGPGGEHPLMGTHNRLLKIATPGFPQAYLEIIAVNPDEGLGGSAVCAGKGGARAAGGGHGAERTAAQTRRRWFDMDEPAVRERVQRDGPQLIHWVAAVPDIAATVAALAVQGVDRGEVLQASRQTPSGLLQWQISVRPDGQRLFDGCLPTLIQWGDTHPTHTMPSSGLTLHALRLRHPQADALRQALASIALPTMAVTDGPAQLSATLQTPKGLIEIHT